MWSRNFYFIFSMNLMQFPQVGFKLYEINTNLRQVCKFSEGKNTRILVYNTISFVSNTTVFFFQHNEINPIINLIRIFNPDFWFSCIFFTASVTCYSKSTQYDLFATITFQMLIYFWNPFSIYCFSCG